MSALTDATDSSRLTLRFAVTAAALGVVGMFTAAATFSASDIEAGEVAPAALEAQR